MLAAGGDHTCGIRLDGTLWCWGDDLRGELGDDSFVVSRISPTQVGTDSDWVVVSAGYSHTCALKSDSSLWCWGENAYGALALGQAWQITPLQVP